MNKSNTTWTLSMCVFILLCLHVISGNPDKVFLNEVQVLTLHHGQMTQARRSSPVPQLKCLGGTAGCTAFKPNVVQCYNRGSDGYDVQWECKTDMDNSYRFGKVEVTCEGYSYPEDPFILRGSCGLEYTIDLTEEGIARKNSGNQGNHHQQQHQYYDDSYHHRSHVSDGLGKKVSSIVSDLFYLAIIAIVIYAIYKFCIASPTTAHPGDPPPSYDDTYRPHGNTAPPPYGFRQDYMPGGNSGDSCSSGAGYSGSHTYTGAGGPSTGGGFWSGAFTGGMLGYLLGNRNNTYAGYQRPHTGWWGGSSNWGTGWGNNWGSGTRTFTAPSAGSSFSAGVSSGTRTASGFGGTRRR
ncbi:store-operated calcium entry-associated regulatory factor-like [Dreissena polymorpha]|uniref:Store-operated calcium entry-associated regulatory factor n=1 Tax=Dreissena polymorpha TaxID=45954 RepID=A0A9D4JIW9_DREPO|nr:store-operated calcium entry-associated regulatory factor-like [Dreissena polymorpha]XP_052214615.1 store-operated calcium entry-associated regulatory factor-like [Dreissena polymorpha]KAH3809167.1 hypothetical protein DPMN_137528 [Dreissena polymorpha]